MKKVCIISMCLLFCTGLLAQKKGKIYHYEMFIYTDKQLSSLIPEESSQSNEEERSLGEAAKVVGNAVLSGPGSFVSAFVDMGIGALTSLWTKKEENKKRWNEMVASENSYQEVLSTERSINEFYDSTSTKSPLDPLGMKFDGIGCLRKVGNDTVFFVSCHINRDRDKIKRIRDHSKFELSLDTLIINPLKCNLPDSEYDTIFDFKDRKDLCISLEMKITSSWINDHAILQKDQELGSFLLNIPVLEHDLNENKELRYVRQQGESVKYIIEGESFIVPRSYMGDRNGIDYEFKDKWGTGEYNVIITLKENCTVTENYSKNWKADFKARQKWERRETPVAKRMMKVVKEQVWDNQGKKWIISTIKAPADMVVKDLNKAMEIK